MNEFAYLGETHRAHHGADDDLVALSVPIAVHNRAAVGVVCREPDLLVV